MDIQGSGRGFSVVVRCLLLGAAGVLLLTLAGARWGTAPNAAPASQRSVVLVAARSLSAGSTLAAGDVRTQQLEADAALPGTLQSPGQVAGHRLLVSVPAGTALLAPMLAPPGPAAGRRTVVIVTDADHVDPRLAAGVDVDIVAAVDSDSRSGSVSLVATGRVVSVSAAGDTAVRSTPGRSAASMAVALDCDAESALRIIWAESYARSVRLLVRGGDDGPAPSAVAGISR